MKKPLTKKTKASLLLLASIVFTPLVIYAEKLDIEQEILISADRQAGDLKNKIANGV